MTPNRLAPKTTNGSQPHQLTSRSQCQPAREAPLALIPTPTPSVERYNRYRASETRLCPMNRVDRTRGGRVADYSPRALLNLVSPGAASGWPNVCALRVLRERGGVLGDDRVRAAPKAARLAIIDLTGNSRETARRRCSSVGRNGRRACLSGCGPVPELVRQPAVHTQDQDRVEHV